MKKLMIVGLTAMMVACNPQKDSTFTFDEMTYSPSETVFKLFAPATAKCSVVLDGDTLPMTQLADTIWTVTAKGRKPFSHAREPNGFSATHSNMRRPTE